MLRAIETFARLGVATILAMGSTQAADGDLSLAYACTSPTIDTASGGSFTVELQQNSVVGNEATSNAGLELIPGCISASVQLRPEQVFADSFE